MVCVLCRWSRKTLIQSRICTNQASLGPYSSEVKPDCSKMTTKIPKVSDNARVNKFESWLGSDAAKMVRIVERLTRC